MVAGEADGASERRGKEGIEGAMHLFLIASIVTTSKALVTTSDALVPSSLLFLILEGHVLSFFRMG